MPRANLQEKIFEGNLHKKDKEAFIKAYDLYLDHIYRYVFFKVSDSAEAEDLTSQVFLRTWDYVSRNKLKSHKTIKPLLYKIARNLVIDHYRQNSAKEDVSLDKDPSSGNLPDLSHDIAGEVATRNDFEILLLKMRELKDEYREVIVLRYVNELSIGEIAASLNKTKGNVRVLIFRAMNALKELSKDQQ